MRYELNKTKLEVYLEMPKRRLFAGTLTYDAQKDQYVFDYDIKFLRSKSSFPVGPDLPKSKVQHISKPGELFGTFLDRIPSKENPAYPEYCQSQGIAPDEENLIVLLGTIGRRGPSDFIYEAVYQPVGDVVEELLAFRKQLELSRWDVAMMFDIPEITLAKIEARKSRDSNVLQLLSIYLHYPQVMLDKLEQTGKKVHRDTRTKVYRYFRAG